MATQTPIPKKSASKPAAQSDWIASIMRSRADRDTEMAVNSGLVAASIGGMKAGARLMQDRRVPIDVARRVLLHPEQRRATDWKPGQALPADSGCHVEMR